MNVKVKHLFFSFLNDLTDNSLFKIIIATMYLTVYAFISMCVCLCISEMNIEMIQGTGGRREELGILCYYKVLATTRKEV